MSAKRELYKSANVETDTPKTNRRRALAQGRLVTDPPGYDMIPKVTSETKSSPNVSLLSSSMMARMSLTKSHLDSSKADSMLHDSMQSSLLQKSRIENFETLAEKAHATTPRRGIPVSHQSPSPAVLRPSVSLDLSDAESETQPCNDVIKVDATKTIAFPAESNSPVRVVSHSAETTSTEIPDEETESQKVLRDPGHSVILTADTQHTVDGKKPELARALFSGSMNESREVSIDSKRHSIDDESRVSESPAKSIDCSSEVKKKKKKAVRLIASRYMSSTSRPSAPTSHSTSNHRQPMRATDRDILKKSVPCKRPQPNVLAPKRTGGSARKLAPKVTRHRSVERTPDVSKPPGPKASTPEIEMSSHLAVDISAIDSHHSHHSHSSHLSTPGAPPQTNCKSNRSNSTSMKKADESSLPSSKTEEFSQTHVDILYARYLQTVYLEARAKHDFKLQEKHSMSQLHGLWLQNEQLQKRSAELKLQLSKLKHLNSLDTAVDDQLRGLSPVLPHLDVVQQQYSALAGALDTTRHQLSTKDVYLPDDELSFHENLTAALLESERLLGELSVMIRTKTPEISRFAQTLSSCTETVMKQLRHIDTCSDLVSSAHKLSTQECSLKIQDMQLKDIH